jgi:hypothetical protein
MTETDDRLPEVFCPYTQSACIAVPNEDGSPACPSPRERVCVNGLPGEDE